MAALQKQFLIAKMERDTVLTVASPSAATLSPPSKTVLMDKISVRQAALPRTITARPPWALRRKNCEFSLRSFCVVGSEMMGSDGL